MRVREREGETGSEKERGWKGEKESESERV